MLDNYILRRLGPRLSKFTALSSGTTLSVMKSRLLAIEHFTNIYYSLHVVLGTLIPYFLQHGASLVGFPDPAFRVNLFETGRLRGI